MAPVALGNPRAPGIIGIKCMWFWLDAHRDSNTRQSSRHSLAHLCLTPVSHTSLRYSTPTRVCCTTRPRHLPSQPAYTLHLYTNRAHSSWRTLDHAGTHPARRSRRCMPRCSCLRPCRRRHAERPPVWRVAALSAAMARRGGAAVCAARARAEGAVSHG